MKKTIRQFTNGKGVTKETIRSVVLEMMKPQKERVLRQCQEHNQWKIEQIYGKKKGRYLTDDNYSLKSLMVLCYSMKFKNDVMNDLNGNIVWKKYGRAYSGRTLKSMVENGEFDWLLADEEFIDIVGRLFDLVIVVFVQSIEKSGRGKAIRCRWTCQQSFGMQITTWRC